MIVLACGGRGYSNRRYVFKILDQIHERVGITLLVHGGARGADTLAGEWAESRGVPVQVFPADWERHGYRAGAARNAKMLREAKPRLCVAFAGGRGTADMVCRCQAAKVAVFPSWRYE